jgi:hypothetical protein
MSCKYNLRGLPSDGNCPECGRAIAESVRDQAELVPLETLHRVRRAVWCFIAMSIALLLGGAEFFCVERGLGLNPANAGTYRAPLLVALWLTKLIELAAVLLAVHGLFVISRPASPHRIEDGAMRLRKLLSYAFWAAPAVALGHLISFLAPSSIVAEIGFYVRELAAGAALLTVPSLALAYVAGVTNRCGRQRVALVCVGACGVVSLFHLLVLYAYVREYAFLGELPSPTCFSTLTWWAHTISGLPLPGLSAYYWLGWQNASFLWPIVICALVLVSLIRAQDAIASVLRDRKALPVEDSSPRADAPE